MGGRESVDGLVSLEYVVINKNQTFRWEMVKKKSKSSQMKSFCDFWKISTRLYVMYFGNKIYSSSLFLPQESLSPHIISNFLLLYSVPDYE